MGCVQFQQGGQSSTVRDQSFPHRHSMSCQCLVSFRINSPDGDPDIPTWKVDGPAVVLHFSKGIGEMEEMEDTMASPTLKENQTGKVLEG